jgi:hypothetical protein
MDFVNYTKYHVQDRVGHTSEETLSKFVSLGHSEGAELAGIARYLLA